MTGPVLTFSERERRRENIPHWVRGDIFSFNSHMQTIKCVCVFWYPCERVLGASALVCSFFGRGNEVRMSLCGNTFFRPWQKRSSCHPSGVRAARGQGAPWCPGGGGVLTRFQASLTFCRWKLAVGTPSFTVLTLSIIHCRLPTGPRDGLPSTRVDFLQMETVWCWNCTRSVKVFLRWYYGEV